MTSKLLVFYFVLICIVSSGSFAQEQKVNDKVTIETSDPLVRSQAKNFFSKEFKGEMNRSTIAEAIRKFYIGKSVYLVQVFEYEEGGQKKYRIAIQSKPRLNKIEVLGSKSVDSSDIVSRLPITVGDSISPDQIPTMDGKIKEYYASRGFRQAEVQSKIQETEILGQAKLNIQVSEGAPCKWDKVEMEVDGKEKSLEELQDWLNVKPGGRCDLEKVRRGSIKIENKLRDEGFLSANIPEANVFWDEEKHKGVLQVKVTIGPKIDVRFFGNTFFFERDRVLMQASGFDEEKRFNRSWIETTAVEGIQHFYQMLGYPNAKVHVDEEDSPKENRRNITFKIQRGEKNRILKVVFDGVKNVDVDDVTDAFWSAGTDVLRSGAYVPEDVEAAVQGILAFYQSKGFLRATVSPHRPVSKPHEGVEIKFEVDEGVQSRLKGFLVTGNRVISTEDILAEFQVSPGSPINPVAFSKAQEKISEIYRSKGYKFVTVTIPSLESIPEGEVEYSIKIREGKRVRFGDITIKGNLATKDYVIERELVVKEGELYSPEKLRDTRRNLLKLGFFQQIAVEETSFDPETEKEDVIVSVSERKKRSLKFRPGYSTDVGVRGELDLAYINIGGTGRSASVNGEISRKLVDADIVAHREVFSYREPKIFNYVDGRINLINEQSEEIQFDIERRSIILGLDRAWSAWLRSSLQWELEFRNPYHVQEGAVLSPIDEEHAKFGSISSIFDFDFRNDFLNPTRGTFHRLKFDLYNDSLFSDADFAQVYLRNSFYIPIYKRIRVVTAVRMGFSGTYGKTETQGISEVPIEKRFRLGGSSTLRGFGFNCVGGVSSTDPEQCNNDPKVQAPGGNAMFNYMTDLLFPIFGGLDLALFTDGGNAFLHNSDFDITNIRTSAGVGIRYNTFFGPLRLDVGFKLDRRKGEDLTEIHFAVGQF